MDLFRRSTIWVIDYLYEGRPRRWFQALAAGVDAQRFAADALRDRHEGKARLVAVRPASAQEELEYLHGEEPRNVYCPTGRPPHDREALEPPPDPLPPLSGG